ncbi:hypothetical protein [Nonomuraea sp. bgisy101]|uniref:hypothetical protein n=1 Tax=Nonomuraea sp. bgisy101 TaxID=3413784 RepID=UPI003D7452CA
MRYDEFGTDQTRIIRDLERRIEVLEAQARTRPGAPVTQASGPLFLPNSSTPATPSGGCAIYAVSGGFRVIDSSGTVRQITAGAAVSNPTLVMGDAPGSYTTGYANTQSAAINELNNRLTALLTSLRNAGVISTV